MRISCAMPRASLRSVFTVMADSAAFTWRVSIRMAGMPALTSPACSHCDSGPASRPTRVKLTSAAEKTATSASGSLLTLSSRTIRPLPSTTQTLHWSRDTSIPA